MSAIIYTALGYKRTTREQAEAIDAKLNQLVAMGRGGAQASPPPAFSPEDIEEVGRLLIEGRIKLPCYTRLTVLSEVETVKDPIFGTYDITTHTPDQLHVHQISPMTVLEALEAGLVAKLGNTWVWREHVYKLLVSPDPRLRPHN